MTKVLIHYGEIGLKGKNKPDYERKLVNNIKRVCKHNELDITEIERKNQRLVVVFDSENKKLIKKTLKQIFGIKNFSFVREIAKNIESIKSEAIKIMKNLKEDGIEIISFKTKRSDKNFKYTSPEINNELRYIAEKELGLKVDYKNQEEIIYLEISFKSVFIYGDKIKGLGGLPVSSSGRILCLLSGGIDSPVAAYQMMKRGCMVDFVHVHNFATNELAKKSRLKTTVEIVNKYQIMSKVFLVPYSIFEFETMNKYIYDRYQLILFKHYILKLAERLAIDYDYDAIVTGDNLAQVASQTMENLIVTSCNNSKIILRPLLTYEKEEIIEKAKQINTFDESIKEYKDCCSLVAKNPTTKAKQEKFNKVLDNVNIDELVEKSVKDIERFLVY